jgi:hypothetical protein
MWIEEKTINEVKEAMKGMDTEELVRWLKHVEDNPYRVGDVSRKIIEVLTVEVRRRGHGTKTI